MADDIVTRLRNECQCSDDCRAVNDPCISMRAADEIERLREWKELAYEMRNKYWWFMRAKTLRKFDAMHKSDWKLHGLLGDRRE